MNKRGFTLIELLAVIVVLAILVLLAMPQVTSMMERARVNSFVTEANQIAKVAQNAYNDSMFDDDIGTSTTCYTIDELISKGYLDKDPGEIRGAVVLDTNATTKDVKVYTYISKDKYYIKGDIGSKTGKIVNSDVKKNNSGSLFNNCTTTCTATQHALSVMCGETELTNLPATGSNVYTVTFDADGGVINGQELINFDASTHNVNGLAYRTTWGTDYLEFNRANSSVVSFGVYNTPTLMLAADVSVSAFVSGSNHFILTNVHSGGFQMGLVSSDHASKANYLYTNINFGTESKAVFSKIAAQLNQRYKIVASYDGVYFKMYVNGELTNTVVYSGTILYPQGQTPVVLGANPNPNTPINGVVDSTPTFSGKVYSAYLYSNPRYTKTVTYKDTYGTLPTPTKPYHTFTGWYDSSNNLVTSDTVYNTAGNTELIAKYTYNG